jgi:hypothetical protein
MIGEEGFFKGLEQKIAGSVITENYERSTMDKVTAKDEVASLRALMKKKRWEKDDLFEASYLLTANEAKLWYLDEWERYIVGKFFVWLREFLSIEQTIISYQDSLDENKTEISPEAKQSLEQSRMLMENINKTGIDCYLYVARTSLSVNGRAFETLTSNTYEIVYPQDQSVVQQNEKKGMFGGVLKKGVN